MEDTKKRRMMPLLLLLTVVFSFNAWSSASISAAKTMDTKAETKGSEKSRMSGRARRRWMWLTRKSILGQAGSRKRWLRWMRWGFNLC